MGLLDVFKGNKEKPKHICYRCKKEFSGIFNGRKLSDGEYICSDCSPAPTKLMRYPKVCNASFDYYDLDSEEMDKYIAYRAKEAERAKEFSATETAFNGDLLIDRPHMWFKLKDYEEIFFIQQIRKMLCIAGGDDGKYTIACLVLLNNNAIYGSLPELSYKFRAKAFFKKKQKDEVIAEIQSLHQQVAPNSELEILVK